MRDWFASLESRERIFVVTGAAVVGIAILYALVWMPLDKGQQRLSASVLTKAEQVWCAKDRKAALTRAKLGANPSGEVCANNPVGEDYDLGHELGVTGTPAIFASNGELLGGYLSPSELVKSLAEAGSQ